MMIRCLREYCASRCPRLSARCYSCLTLSGGGLGLGTALWGVNTAIVTSAAVSIGMDANGGMGTGVRVDLRP